MASTEGTVDIYLRIAFRLTKKKEKSKNLTKQEVFLKVLLLIRRKSSCLECVSLNLKW
jgi:hypothetical protein